MSISLTLQLVVVNLTEWEVPRIVDMKHLCVDPALAHKFIEEVEQNLPEILAEIVEPDGDEVYSATLVFQLDQDFTEEPLKTKCFLADVPEDLAIMYANRILEMEVIKERFI